MRQKMRLQLVLVVGGQSRRHYGMFVFLLLVSPVPVYRSSDPSVEEQIVWAISSGIMRSARYAARTKERWSSQSLCSKKLLFQSCCSRWSDEIFRKAHSYTVCTPWCEPCLCRSQRIIREIIFFRTGPLIGDDLQWGTESREELIYQNLCDCFCLLVPNGKCFCPFRKIIENGENVLIFPC